MNQEEVRKFARDTLEAASRQGSVCVYWNARHAKPCKTSECVFQDSHMRYVIGVYNEDALLEWIEDDVWEYMIRRREA